MIDMHLLQQVAQFAELDHNILAKIAAITNQKTIPAGTVMFRRGDNADFLYLILRGRIRIDYPLAGGKLLNVQVLRDGDVLVWSAVVAPYKVTANGTATQDTLVLAIDAVKLREFFETDPVLGYILTSQITKMLADRLENARAKFATLLEHLDDLLAQTKQ